MRVLVVDDEQEICLLLGNMLRKMGHKTATASSVDEGRKKLVDYHPDLVLLDLFLPDGNGLSLVPELKNVSSNPQIIVNSAYDGESERRKADKAGVDYFLSKPLSRNSLQRAMQAIH